MKNLLRDRRVAVAAAVAVLAVVGPVLVARSLAGRDQGIDVFAITRPAPGTWLGSWVGSRYGHSRPQRERAVLELESKLGRKLAIDHTYVPWGTPIGWQPAWDLAQGRIPMISFGNQGDTREVAAGRHDAYLRSLAEQVRALNRPVLLRYAYEMDGDGNRGWVRSGPEYVAAWRHVRRLFDGVGARAAWVWAPNASAFGDSARVAQAGLVHRGRRRAAGHAGHARGGLLRLQQHLPLVGRHDPPVAGGVQGAGEQPLAGGGAAHRRVGPGPRLRRSGRSDGAAARRSAWRAWTAAGGRVPGSRASARRPAPG